MLTAVRILILAALAALLAGAEKPTAAQLAAIDWSDAGNDADYECPFADDLEHLDELLALRKRYDALVAKLPEWKPGKAEDAAQRVRSFVALAAVADLGQSEFESELPLAILDRLKATVEREDLVAALYAVMGDAKGGTVVTSATDLGIPGSIAEDQVRERSQRYAKKMLGRVLGKLPATKK